MILVLLDAQLSGDSDFDTYRKFTKLPVLTLRYLGICNVLHIWHIRVIPILIESTDSMILLYYVFIISV